MRARQVKSAGMIWILLLLGITGLMGCSAPKPVLLTGGPLDVIRLPAPHIQGGLPLMQALNQRESRRSFSSAPLPSQVLSDLLWAAFGVNRPESGKRTAPSALNWQETDIYVFDEKGVYLYDAHANMLYPVAAGDFRGETGSIIQPFVKTAPINLVYVVDAQRTGVLGKMMDQAEREMFSAAAVGFISQNVYLYCASEGLATVVRGLVDRDAVRARLSLRPEQKIILAQSVGYPEEPQPIQTLSLENIPDGSYPGEAPNEDAVYRVRVNVSGHRIIGIDVVDVGSEEFREAAEEALSGLVSAETVPVDAMSGATPATRALSKAVENALQKADKE